MKVLFDQGTPVPLRRFLHPHVVDTADERGWSRLRNGDLLMGFLGSRLDIRHFGRTANNVRSQLSNVDGRDPMSPKERREAAMDVPNSEVYDTSLCFRIVGQDALHVFPVREAEAERLRDIFCADPATDKPTSFMMTTVMAGIMVARVGHRRSLLCPPQEGPTAFLEAMGLDSNAFIEPGCQCTPIIPRKSA